MGNPHMSCCGQVQGDVQGHGGGHVQGHVHAEASIKLFICTEYSRSMRRRFC